MATDVPALTLSYSSFAQFWKALVSKRKARKLNVDRDLAWLQLTASGENAEFLRAHAASKSGKSRKRDEKSPVSMPEAAAVTEPAPKPKRDNTSKAKNLSKKSGASSKRSPAASATRSAKPRFHKGAERRSTAATRKRVAAVD